MKRLHSTSHIEPLISKVKVISWGVSRHNQHLHISQSVPNGMDSESLTPYGLQSNGSGPTQQRNPRKLLSPEMIRPCATKDGPSLQSTRSSLTNMTICVDTTHAPLGQSNSLMSPAQRVALTSAYTRAPRATAWLMDSITSTPAPSPITKPSRAESNGRDADVGLSDVESAFRRPKPARLMASTQDSVPPATCSITQRSLIWFARNITFEQNGCV